MSEEKSIHIIKFLGKALEWRMFEYKFMAKAIKLGYSDLLDRMVEVPKKGNLDTANAKLNKTAIADLMLSMTNHMLMNIVIGTKMVEYPYGNFAVAWKRLKESDELTKKNEVVELKQMFASFRLGNRRGDGLAWID